MMLLNQKQAKNGQRLNSIKNLLYKQLIRLVQIDVENNFRLICKQKARESKKLKGTTKAQIFIVTNSETD